MCTKLGAGYNARHTQPRNGRAIRAFIDLAEAGGDTGDSGLDYYLPKDPHKALAAGAVAGIVLGVLCGSALTAGRRALASGTGGWLAARLSCWVALPR